MNVAVLLSTYNGETYLREQLDSLLSQDFKDFKIYVRDDGSSDGTISIVEKYCNKDERVIKVLSDGNIGCAASFLTLLKSVEADVYMFCDQDDIWLPNKIQRVVDYYSKANMNVATLYHCDLKVVDQELNLIHSSFLKHQKMSAMNAMTRDNLFIQNFVVGCSSAINLSLAKIVLENLNAQHFNKIAMHDWWFAITAKVYGEIFYDDVQTILYRQHSNNVLGAKSSGVFRFINLGVNGQGLKRVLSFRKKVSEQNKLLLDLYESDLNDNQKKKIKLVINALGENANLSNLFKAFWNGCYMQGGKRNLALIYSVIFSKNEIE